MRFSKLRFAILIPLLLLVACAGTTSVRQIDRLYAVEQESPKLLVMPPDIKYYLLTAGGVPEPHGQWSSAAQDNFGLALQAFAQERGTTLVILPPDAILGNEEVAYQKLYSAVGFTILANYYNSQMRLPSKSGSFDWSLGPGVQLLADNYNADYALFSFYRDYQASGGRIAFAALAALAGVSVHTGSEGGFAALVDLRTGDIVWFNRVVAGSGELRKVSGANAAVESLFKDFPER